MNYKDFYPVVLKSGLFSTQYESLGSTVERANQWLQESGVRLINVETVVLPNTENEQAASRATSRTSGEIGSTWCQVVRVWYGSVSST